MAQLVSESERIVELDDERLAPLHAAFCGVFADGKRLRIMWFIKDGERRVNEIAEHLGISQQNVSQHLRLMRDRGALVARREGNAVFYRVANPKFLQGARLIREGLLEEIGRLTELSSALSSAAKEK